jgi:hypothetical protein
MHWISSLHGSSYSRVPSPIVSSSNIVHAMLTYIIRPLLHSQSASRWLLILIRHFILFFYFLPLVLFSSSAPNAFTAPALLAPSAAPCSLLHHDRRHVFLLPSLGPIYFLFSFLPFASANSSAFAVSPFHPANPLSLFPIRFFA